MDIKILTRWAEEEVTAILRVLPEEIVSAAVSVPISYEERPGAFPHDDELAGDELGLFEGHTAMDEPDPSSMPRIRLFLLNLWEWVEEDEQDFRDEIGTTFLHELGHYLGWDEDEVAERGLE